MIGVVFGRGLVSGYGAISAPSVTTTGDITSSAGNITATTGNVRGEILEFASNASAPGVRDYVDTDTGFGRTAANQPAVWSGGTQVVQGTGGAGVVIPANIELSARGRLETRLEERKSWRTTVTVAAATQIPVAGAMSVRVDPSGGPVTSTAAPLFSGSPGDGDEVTLVNINATNAYTLNHHGNGGVNSGLYVPGGTTIALPALTGSITFRYQASDSRWYPIATTI